MPSTMKVLLAMSGFYFCGCLTISVVRCFCYGSGPKMDASINGGHGSVWSAKQQALAEYGRSKQPVAEAYVISLHESKFNVFQQRHFDIFGNGDGDDDTSQENEHQIDISVTLEWYKGYDGMDQAVLDDFSRTTDLFRINASDFEGATTERLKSQYISPHAVGCYLSHWRLLEKRQKDWRARNRAQRNTTSAATQKPPGKPDMLFVFEDDAHCVSNLVERTWSVVQKLPKDWDILYVGGKPFSMHTGNKTLKEFGTNQVTEEIPRPSDMELAKRMCEGEFGSPSTGPFVPGTTSKDSYETVIGANLAEDPPYWEVKRVLNTNAYVINPKRIQRVLRVLSKPMNQYKPIDVTLAEDFDRAFMNPYEAQFSMEGPSAPLKAFLTPKLYCDQGVHRLIANRNQPAEWEGFHWIPWRKAKGYPDRKGFMWGKMASRQTCAEFLNGQADK